jgi:RHS repeat-associated protein
MAARRRGAEKPHQGVSTRNRALHRGFARCKSRNALALREAEPKNRVRSFCSGEQYDSDLGLYYLRARYYNPATGRFLSIDPLEGNVKDSKTLHKYLYANGDPINRTDPKGREAMAEDEQTDLAIRGYMEKGIAKTATAEEKVYFCTGITLLWMFNNPIATGREALWYYEYCIARVNGQA